MPRLSKIARAKGQKPTTLARERLEQYVRSEEVKIEQKERLQKKAA